MPTVRDLAEWAPALAEPILAENEIPGAVIAVGIDGQRSVVAVGHADLERHVPLRADARMPIYSVTKIVIGSLVMRAVERGLLALDQPLTAVLHDLDLSPEVTVRRVLNHSAGLPDYGGIRAYHEGLRAHPESPWSDAEFLAATLSGGLIYPPGEGWRYSNIGYLLLRQVLERVHGASFGSLVAEAFPDSEGWASFRVLTDLAGMRALSPGYSTAIGDGQAVVPINDRYHPGWVSHGLVGGTASDLVDLLEALIGGSLVTETSLAAMRVPVPVGMEHPWIVEPCYGLGLMLDPGSPYGLIAGHTGGGPGFGAAAYHAPDIAGLAVSVGVLVNGDRGDAATALAFAVFDAIATTRMHGNDRV